MQTYADCGCGGDFGCTIEWVKRHAGTSFGCTQPCPLGGGGRNANWFIPPALSIYSFTKLTSASIFTCARKPFFSLEPTNRHVTITCA